MKQITKDWLETASLDLESIALDSLYIESRYPGEFGLLPEGKPNQKQAQRFYEFAQEIYETVKHHLETRKYDTDGTDEHGREL